MSRIALTHEREVALWYQALEAEHGIVLSVEPDAVKTIKANLYLARRVTEDPRLNVLSITIRADGTQLWIWRKPEATLDD